MPKRSFKDTNAKQWWVGRVLLDPAEISDRPPGRLRFNPTRESSNLFVPGLMAFVLTIISSLMTAISLTREKETGTMEALLVSPLRPWEIIVGKVTPYLAVGFISMIAVLVSKRGWSFAYRCAEARSSCSRVRSSFSCRSRSAS